MAGILLLAGCARSVAVDPPSSPDPQAAELCTTFTSALPDSLETAGERRDVDPASDLTAAYGDPPVAIRCGVPTPDALTPTSQLVTVDGVDWLPEQLTEGWLLTTVGRQANVEVSVPSARGPAPSMAADLAPTIESTIPASAAG